MKDWEWAAQVQWNSWRGSLFVGRSTSQIFAFSSTKLSVKVGWYCHFISSCSLLTFQTSISFVYSAKSRQFRLVLRDSLCVAWDWRFRVYSAGSSAKNQWGYWWVSWSCYYGLDWGTTVFWKKIVLCFYSWVVETVDQFQVCIDMLGVRDFIWFIFVLHYHSSLPSVLQWCCTWWNNQMVLNWN